MAEAERDDHMPEPEAIWIALALITWALVAALSPTARGRFIGALKRLTNRQEERQGVVSFGPAGGRKNAMWAASRSAVAWLKRLIEELERANWNMD